MKNLVMITMMAIAMIATVSIGIVSADGGKKVDTKVDIKGLEAFEGNAPLSKQLKICPREHQGRQGRHSDLGR